MSVGVTSAMTLRLYHQPILIRALTDTYAAEYIDNEVYVSQSGGWLLTKFSWEGTRMST